MSARSQSAQEGIRCIASDGDRKCTVPECSKSTSHSGKFSALGGGR